MTFSDDSRETVLHGLQLDGARVLRREDHLGGATGTCLFALCDLTGWLESNPWLIQGVISAVITNPLYDLTKYAFLKVYEKASTPAPIPHIVAGVIADIDLYGMFARAHLSASEKIPLKETRIRQSAVLGSVTAENAPPYFNQWLEADGVPWIAFIAESSKDYFAVTLDCNGALVSLVALGSKPDWMLAKGK